LRFLLSRPRDLPLVKGLENYRDQYLNAAVVESGDGVPGREANQRALAAGTDVRNLGRSGSIDSRSRNRSLRSH
jgi:hypothetical protein